MHPSQSNLWQQAPGGKSKLRLLWIINLRDKQHTRPSSCETAVLIQLELYLGRYGNHNDHKRERHDYNRHDMTVTSMHIPSMKPNTDIDLPENVAYHPRLLNTRLVARTVIDVGVYSFWLS